MHKSKSIYLLIILAFGAILLSEAFFVVQQTQSALVLQFGKIVKKYKTPGLKAKLPFVQDVTFLDNRLLRFNLPALEVNAADQKRLVVDLFVRYRIIDVLSFYQTIGSNVKSVENKLYGIVLDNMQEVIARFPLAEMLSEKRSAIMEEIHQKVANSATRFGVNVHDVRIIRTDLPKENSEAIFDRMESERKQEANQFRAEGEEQGKIIVAQADKDRTIVLSEARKQSDIVKGLGDAEATQIYADAYGLDKEFFKIYRSLKAYETVISPKDTTMILSPKENEFLKYLGSAKK